MLHATLEAAPHAHPTSGPTQLKEELATLSAQSNELNQHLIETARALTQLREQVGHHSSLSERAQRVLQQQLTEAVCKGIERARGAGETMSAEDRGGVERSLLQLAEQMRALHHTLEAPLVIQRTPTPDPIASRTSSAASPRSAGASTTSYRESKQRGHR